MRNLGLSVLLLFASIIGAGASQKQAKIITAPTVRLIESQMVMPRGAAPLMNYDRYYMLNRIGELVVVEGRFMQRDPYERQPPEGSRPVPGVPGAFTIQRGGRLPDVADGGCSVVTILFDIRTRKLLPVQWEGDKQEPELGICNGFA